MNGETKDTSNVSIGLVKLVGGVVFVVIAILSQWFYLLVQVHGIQQQSDDNKQIIRKLDDKLDELDHRKLDNDDFEKRHQDLAHRVDNLEDMHKRGAR